MSEDKEHTLLPGQMYRFRGIKGPVVNGKQRWKYPPGNYVFVGLATSDRTRQPLVFYTGVGGWDDGNNHVACLSDWLRDFELILPEPVPEKVAGGVSQGSGV